MSKKDIRCLGCNTLIWRGSTRCKTCAMKAQDRTGKKHPLYGKPSPMRGRKWPTEVRLNMKNAAIKRAKNTPYRGNIAFCSLCGIEVKRSPSFARGNVYCSHVCFSKSRIGKKVARRPFTKEHNPNYRGGRLCSCDNCNKLVWRAPYRLNADHCYCSQKCQGEWQSNNVKYSDEQKKQMSIILKRKWREPGYAEKMMAAWSIKPTKPELALAEIILGLKLPYKYVGDGEFILAGKCPDFLNMDGQKKLIEIYGNYWHRNDNPQERTDLFAKYGYDTLIIWESELKNLDEVKEKILAFNGETQRGA